MDFLPPPPPMIGAHSGVVYGRAVFPPRRPACVVFEMQFPPLEKSFKLLHQIGIGRWATIHLAECLPLDPRPAPEHLVAIKILSKEATDHAGPGGEYRELEWYQRLDKLVQPLELPRLFGAYVHKDSQGDHLALALSLYGESVDSWRRKAPSKSLPVPITKIVLACSAEGLRELHRAGLIHTDVKADNVLIENLDSDEHILSESEKVLAASSSALCVPVPHKLTFDISPTDMEFMSFTLADLSNAMEEGQLSSTGTISATALRSPEVILGAEPFTKKVDTWALGCMAFELLTGHWMFELEAGETWSLDDDHLAKILEFSGLQRFEGPWLEKASRRDEFLDSTGNLLRIDQIFPNSIQRALIHYGLDPERAKPAADWITFCLTPDPWKRPEIKEVATHPWLMGAFGVA